ncbi:hypothetical protein [Arthrobacter sp. zg-Y1110]|uniref:hypothetical protein n=1 Tax=Arthrobacter sp. zg-Y1110 TaxID=2886932 RepID=UPI0021B06A1F|nr:hypothetical protein [Arthrobacter sp. zg-Y1110]UWX85580.1 hypothetical protein N2K99_03210 [Arthrobacter sp. zg-Y1110]
MQQLSKVLLIAVLLSLLAGISGCAERNETMTAPDGPATNQASSTDKTSRESYDEFVAQMDEILAVTGAQAGWTTEFSEPWPLEPGNVLTPEPCDVENWRTSPYQLSLQVLGPGAEDLQADRDAMIRYMEDQGLEVSGVFGDSSYPERVAWNAFGRGENGLTIDYGTSKDRRSVILQGECSSHPSMQNGVSRDAP